LNSRLPLLRIRHSCKFTTCSEPCFTFGNQIRHCASWLPSTKVEGDSALDTQNHINSKVITPPSPRDVLMFPEWLHTRSPRNPKANNPHTPPRSSTNKHADAGLLSVPSLHRTGSQRTHWRVLCFPRTMTCAQEGYQSFQIK